MELIQKLSKDLITTLIQGDPGRKASHIRTQLAKAKRKPWQVKECSSKGDKRYSALFAKVLLGGKLDSIENFYQKSKVFYDIPEDRYVTFSNFKQAKHAQYLKDQYQLVGFTFNDQRFRKEDLTSWYLYLWLIYFKQHKYLLDDLNRFDMFTDSFAKPNTINSQADVMLFLRYNTLEDLQELLTPFINKLTN